METKLFDKKYLLEIVKATPFYGRKIQVSGVEVVDSLTHNGGYHFSLNVVFKQDDSYWQFPMYERENGAQVGEWNQDKGDRQKGAEYLCYRVYPIEIITKTTKYLTEKPILSDSEFKKKIMKE